MQLSENFRIFAAAFIKAKNTMFFQSSVIKKYLAALNTEQVTAAWEQYKTYFLNREIQDNIRSSKEEQFQEGFLRELFVKVFGYTLNPSPNFNLITEQKNETDAKKADGAILRNDKVIGVIELKDHKTTDLSHVERQAFGYKSQHKDTRYVVISNFEKLRFYIDNAVEHIEWNLFTLTEADFRLLYFCLAWQNICTDLPLKAKQESVSNEDQITQQLYKDYSAFKREIFADILANNTTEQAHKEQILLLFRKTQKLLDRLLFIFFAEDCGLLPPNSMVRILEQWEQLKEMDEYKPLYDRIKKYFGYLDTGYQGKKYEIFAYNGGLFKPDEVLDSIKISDDILARFTRKLADYDYSTEVDVNILGHIFENSLNEIEEVTAQINAGEAPTVSKRKRDGVFYTPQYITKYIVENTVGRLCVEKKTEMGIDESEYFADRTRQIATKKRLLERLEAYRRWLLDITICDPACGSGAFLNAALQFLMAEHKLLDEMYAKVTGGSIVFQETENSILENNLYGVDINEESVEIARLALWLRTAKPHRKLNSLNNNIKCGNSLISDPTIAGDKAFNWQQEFPQVFAKGGFDIVIGNPPYGALFNEKTFDYIGRNYQTAEYKIDAYAIFIERAFNLSKNDAFVSMITPYTYLSGTYFSKLRAFLEANTILNISVMGKKVFADAEVDTGIFIARKRMAQNNHVDIIDYRANEEIRDFNPEDIYSVSQEDLFFDYHNKIIVCPNNQLKLYKKIENVPHRLADFVTFYHGIQTRGNKDSIVEHKLDDTYYPILRGRDFNRYMPPTEQAYFLLKKENIKSGGDLSFHQANEKIVMRTTGDSIVASIDRNRTLVLNSVNILLSNNPNISLQYLLSILSSTLIRFWYKLTVQEQGKTFAEVKIVYLEKIPIPTCSDQQPFIDLADRMLSLNRDLQTKRARFVRRLQDNLPEVKVTSALADFDSLDFAGFVAELKKQKITLTLVQQDEWEDYFRDYKAACNDLTAQIAATDREIDNRVYQLYGLTEEEIKIVEG